MERARSAAWNFADRHPLIVVVFGVALLSTSLYLGIWLEAEVVGMKASQPDPIFLKLAGILFVLGVFGLIVKYALEFEWKEKTSQLEQRIRELEEDR